MIKFSREKVLLLHQILAEATGGGVGVRDEGLLDSALESAFAGYGDKEFYPSKEEKGARLGYTLIANHALVDGNKRIGVYVMLSFLEMNGIRIRCSSNCSNGYTTTSNEIKQPKNRPRKTFLRLPGALSIPDSKRDGALPSLICFPYLPRSALLPIQTP